MSPRLSMPLLSLLLLPAALAAQQTAALADLAGAEAAIAEKRPEEAAILLRSAARRVLSAEDQAVRAELEPRIAVLRAKTDPTAKSADDACAEAANALARVAASYEERGWLRSSRDLLVRAVAIAPAIAQDPLRRIREKLQGQNIAPEAGAATWFQNGETLEGPDGWTATADAITVVAPTAQQRVTRHISSRRADTDRIRWSCEVPRDSVHGIGLVFAYRHSQDFYVAIARPSNGKWFGRIARAIGGDYAYLAEGWLPEPAANTPEAATPSTTIAMRLQVDNGAIRFACGGLELTAKAPAPLRAGFLGLHTEHTGKDGPPMTLSAVAIDAEALR
jgi:hypothetical protein